jgi:hypothetical protein
MPSAAFFASMPFRRSCESGLPEDLHACFVELLAVLLAVLLRGEERQIRRVVVERVVVSVMDVHAVRDRTIGVGEDVAVQVSASAAARRLVIHALGPVIAVGIPLVRNALVHNLNWWIHQAIPSTADTLLLAFYVVRYA